MARETWLSKLKSQISNKLIQIPSARPNKKSSSSSSSRNVGVLAFEVSTLISKLISLHHSLSDPSITRLRNDVVSLDGVRKIVSNDDSFLLTLACSEFIHTLHLVSKSTAQMIISSSSPLTSSSFLSSLEDFASTGRDPHGWACTNDSDASGLLRRADRYVAATSALYRELDELTSLENTLKKRTSSPTRPDSVLELQQKIVWQKQEIKRVKDKSFWNKTFDFVILLLARLIFTVLARIKLVFGIGPHPAALPRSLSTSAAVFPSTDIYASGYPIPRPLKAGSGFFESRTKLLNPPKTTLGSGALALHYANLIIVLEKMIRSPHLVGLEARDDVYSMLPSSIRSALRARLKGRVGYSATDPVLAGEWRDALGRILGWLSPLAHNMIKWQNERSFEQHNMMMTKGGSNNVLLLQTLYFANKDKTEAAITELLVGLNYIWRFEREMNAKALLECSNFFFHNNNMSHSNLQP